MDIERAWHHQLFGIRRSIRYHNRRRAFFDRWDKFTNMAALVFGSAAVYGVLQERAQSVALTAAALVTALSSINLVIGSSQRARAHADFARRFIDLERKMAGIQASPQVLAQIEQDRLAIEADEPPVLQVLDCICHNEELRAQGYPDADFARIRWWQRLLAQIVDIREDMIKSQEPAAKA